MPPPESELATIGAALLGRDIEGGGAVAQIPLPSFSQEALRLATEKARRYGFHATLKAPFRLREDCDLAALKAKVEALAARLSAADIPGFALSELGDFVALRPKGGESALVSLASTCVSELDSFRAPATAAERQARQPERLNERQRDYLDRWGYPYVHDEFRFHMTLSDDMEAARRRRFRDEVDAIAGEVFVRPAVLADLALVRQDTPNASFVVAARFPLGR